MYLDFVLGVTGTVRTTAVPYTHVLFPDRVWLWTVVSVVVWGVTLWLLMRIRHLTTKGRRFDLPSALFYGWGLLLEDRPYEPPDNPTGQASLLRLTSFIHYARHIVNLLFLLLLLLLLRLPWPEICIKTKIS